MRAAAVIVALFFLAPLVFAHDLALPAPRTSAGMDLLQAIHATGAAAGEAPRAITPVDLSTILWAAASAGLHSGDTAHVSVYLLNERGVFRYVPQKNVLSSISHKDERGDVVPEAARSSGVLVFACDFGRMPQAMAGAAARDAAVCVAACGAQNAALAAASMGLGSLLMHDVEAGAISAAARLAEGEQPLFALQIGPRG